MRPSTPGTFVAGFLTGAAVTVATIVVAAPAHADDRAWVSEYGPAVCDIISSHPTMSGLMVALEDVAASGYTAEQSGELVAESVLTVCPRYVPLLRQFVATFGPRTTT